MISEPLTVVPGSVFTEAYTINSMYAQGKIELKDKDGTRYRIDVETELLPLIQNETWLLQSKRKYQHLVRAPR